MSMAAMQLTTTDSPYSWRSVPAIEAWGPSSSWWREERRASWMSPARLAGFSSTPVQRRKEQTAGQVETSMNDPDILGGADPFFEQATQAAEILMGQIRMQTCATPEDATSPVRQLRGSSNPEEKLL